jgi:hypothetical protein
MRFTNASLHNLAKHNSTAHNTCTKSTPAAAFAMRLTSAGLQKLAKHNSTSHTNASFQNQISAPKQEFCDFEAILNRILKRKCNPPKLPKSNPHQKQSCSSIYNAISRNLQNTKAQRTTHASKALLLQHFQCVSQTLACTTVQNTIAQRATHAPKALLLPCCSISNAFHNR